MNKRPIVLFDGSNFYHGVKRCWPDFHLSNFNYMEFSKLLCGCDDPKVIYYVGEVIMSVRNPRSKILYSQQQAVFYNLENLGIEIKKGFILQNGSVFSEKGVDVQIAVDLAVGAVKNRYDVAYLISSDSDLVPAVKAATQESKKVIYMAFQKFRSISLTISSTSTQYITLAMLKKSGVVDILLPSKQKRRDGNPHL